MRNLDFLCLLFSDIKRDDLIVDCKLDYKEKIIILITGNIKVIKIPFMDFTRTYNIPVNFKTVEVLDFGKNIKFGNTVLSSWNLITYHIRERG